MRLSFNPFHNRWVRVTALATALLGVSSVFAYRSARARTGEALGAIGDEVMRIPLGRYSNSVQHIEINGFQMRIQTAHAKAPFEQVLAQFEEACRTKAGMQNPELGVEELAKMRAEAPASAKPTILDGVFEQETTRGTVVACIDTHGVPWMSHEMIARLKRFSSTGDLSALGTFRYALVKKTSSGAHFVTMWSTDTAPLLKMFPPTGDAPGVDHRYVPRIAGSRRVLSTKTQELQMVAYEHPGEALNDVIDTTERAIVAANLDHKDLGGAPPGARFWVSNGDNQSLMMFAEKNGRVVTTVTDVPP